MSLVLKLGNEMKEFFFKEFLLGNFSDPAILGMPDLQNLGLAIDFENVVVTKGDLWLPVCDVQNKMLGRKVLVKRTFVPPPKQQVILQAEVEGLNDEPVYAINPVLLQINNTLLSDYGILPGRSVHDSTDNGVPVMLYNANNLEVELPSNVVLVEFEGLD